MILAGDIGGTHTRLALFDGKRKIQKEKKFLSQEYKDLETILEEFLQGEKPVSACFGIAGPVRNQKSKVTNLSWTVDAKQVAQRLQIQKVSLLNDLEANGYGTLVLKKEELFVLHEGKKVDANRTLISAGTGLGEAGLFWNGKEHLPFASEGGHVDFAPRNALEVDLLFYLEKKFGHVSYERVVSGPGLLNLFSFLADTGKVKPSKELKEAMQEEDAAKVISEWGVLKKDEACVRALDWFLSLYGSEAGNAALKFLAFGGVYLGGGIAPRLSEKMKEGAFFSSFVSKGRFEEVLASIPILIVMNEDAALLGAASYAMKGV